MTRRSRILSLSFIALLIVVFTFVGTLIGIATDWFWFQEVGYTTVFTTTLKSQLIMGLGSALVLAVFLSVNILACKRVLAERGPLFLHDSIDIPELRFLKGITNKVLLIVVLVLAYLFGQWGILNWEIYLRFRYPSSFGIADPLFAKDIGFYIFTLPFYQFLCSFGLTALVLATVMTSLLYFMYGQVRLTARGINFSKPAKVHLFFLVALILLVMGYNFRLNMFELLYSERGKIFGAGYTDINAELPALWALVGASVLAAVLTFMSAFRPGIKLALVGIGLVIVGSIIGRKLYPEVVQQFTVTPNEISKEGPYIANAIKYTRLAYGIENIVEKEFPAEEALSESDLKKNDLTINNIRLWDRDTLRTTYGQLQEIRTYYSFVDADNDRYYIDGTYRQVMFSPRELSVDKIQDRSWQNEHLTYTHGYGLCLGPVNRVTKEGMPEFFIKDIPPTSSLRDLKVTRPEIYFGEITTSYCFVNTRLKEFDYPSGNENVYTQYQGQGGVLLGNFLRKLIIALRFGEANIMFSSDITPQSRVMYYRRVLERAQKATPFLSYDPDIYMVIGKDGRLFWMCDAYTTTDKFPYSEPSGSTGNYIRNSVKAIVDAYDGSLEFYINDEFDPLIQTYKKIFPGLLKPLSAMREDLKSHIRYPEKLFAIQAKTYATYHMTDPRVFYTKEDLWKIPQRTTIDEKAISMDPYYTIMRLASEGTTEEFILMVPFTPAKKDNMIAWMAARCDAPHYGKMIVYSFPKQKLIYGPQQIESRIDQEPAISKELTLWNQRGSRVIRGSLLVIPIEKSIIYVQPLYLTATQTGSLPELKRVIVAFGNDIAMEDNLEAALSKIFGGPAMKEKAKPTAAEVLPPPTTPLTGTAAEWGSLVERANKHFENALKYQREGNWAGYGEEIKKLEEVLKAMQQQRKSR